MKTTLQTSGAVTAFLIGSGFATGQEALQFFSAYGFAGLAGVAISFAACLYLALAIVLTAKRHRLDNFDALFRHYGGELIGGALSWFTVAMMLCVIALMIGAGGAVLQEAAGLPKPLANGLVGLAMLSTTVLGFERLLAIIGPLGNSLVLLITGVALAAICSSPIESAGSFPPDHALRAAPDWLLSAMLYATLQILGLCGFLPPLAQQLGRRNIRITSIVLGLVVFFAVLMLLAGAQIVQREVLTGTMIPTLALARAAIPQLTDIFVPLFSALILAAIYTTVTSLMSAVLLRFSSVGTLRHMALAIAFIGMTLTASLWFPFDRFMNLLYPLIGYGGMAVLTLVALRQAKTRSISG